MSFDKSTLVGFLEEVDKELRRSITLVAAGGTAMTLLSVKPSTIDIDFTIPDQDYDEFENALNIIPHGFRVDCWKDGMVFRVIDSPTYRNPRLTSISLRKESKTRNQKDLLIASFSRMIWRSILM